jgi:hypothetical protein
MARLEHEREEAHGEEREELDETYSTDAIAFVWGRADMRVVCCWQEQRIGQPCEKLIQIHRDVLGHIRFCCHVCLWFCICSSGVVLEERKLASMLSRPSSSWARVIYQRVPPAI